MIRLDKILAHSGYGSRKEVKELIRKGFVMVNGEIITDDDFKVDEINDEICDVTIEESITTMKYHNLRVLLVDDNEINNFMTKHMLEEYGVEVDIALSGEEGLLLYNKNSYDIVFMDYMLPGMNGIEAVHEIRKCGERGKNQMIIGISAYVMEVFKNELNKLGVELLLMKPVKAEQMGIILLKDFKHKIVSL